MHSRSTPGVADDVDAATPAAHHVGAIRAGGRLLEAVGARASNERVIAGTGAQRRTQGALGALLLRAGRAAAVAGCQRVVARPTVEASGARSVGDCGCVVQIPEPELEGVGGGGRPARTADRAAHEPDVDGVGTRAAPNRHGAGGVPDGDRAHAVVVHHDSGAHLVALTRSGLVAHELHRFGGPPMVDARLDRGGTSRSGGWPGQSSGESKGRGPHRRPVRRGPGASGALILEPVCPPVDMAEIDPLPGEPTIS